MPEPVLLRNLFRSWSRNSSLTPNDISGDQYEDLEISSIIRHCTPVIVFFTYSAGATESSDLKIHVNNPKFPSVAIVTTGGTIAEKADPKTGKSVPAVSGEELVKAVPGLEKVANIGVLNFMNIDSSQMTPEISWEPRHACC